MRVLTLRQPWASLVVNSYKDIENRDWQTKYRGPLLIHAGVATDPWGKAEIEQFGMDLPWKISELPRGGIIGMVTLADCVAAHNSRWFSGIYGFVLTNARTLKFHPCRGKLGLCKAEYPFPIE